MAFIQNNDLKLISEVKTLIDEVIDKVPPKKYIQTSNLGALIVFTLGCIIGFEMFVINLFMTSTVILSIILLGFFFLIGFLMGIYLEKLESLNKSSNPFYSSY
ncbi:MAG: hypothetical protein BWX56_01035 [Euryarchaeota archaeon ADurb.Bin023]|nr:MAG: hypothetical protein BWX56_01035 [Euryarchaeota archaeon ADurb.Bin023]HOE93201.1 hypothetical protein [Methanofastidiosum sp.]HOR88120.1 hypothetical protein [Methanofastidiosum sp.]HPL01028.1 hypothetical protein [Methanofastidiosum sp.]